MMMMMNNVNNLSNNKKRQQYEEENLANVWRALRKHSQIGNYEQKSDTFKSIGGCFGSFRLSHTHLRTVLLTLKTGNACKNSLYHNNAEEEEILVMAQLSIGVTHIDLTLQSCCWLALLQG